MRTFIGLGIHTSLCIGIDRLMEPITQRDTSHQGAWERLIKAQLNHLGYNNVEIASRKSDWTEYDIVILSHGMNYRGAFNVFGGASDELARRLERLLSKSEARLISFEIPMPDVGEFIRRRHKTGTERFKQLDHEKISQTCKAVQHIERIFESKRLCLGDSHILAFYKHGHRVDRHDGLTMHGALKRGLKSLIPDHVEELVLCLGNIDVRFHLHGRGTDAIREMVEELERQLFHLNLKLVEIIAPLFIENESRKLPKSGYHKGKPFNGSWEDRDIIRQELGKLLSEMCWRNGYHFYEQPHWLMNSKRELDMKYMEAGKSVHLAPRYYRWIHGSV